VNVRIGSRGSALALAQTNAVAGALGRHGHEVEVVIIQTAGDRDKQAKFADIGAPGVFVREIEAALLGDDIDLAVHSYKDLPSKGPEGLLVAAIPERLDPADRLVAHRDAVSVDPEGLADICSREIPLLPDAIVGTASERRRALLRDARPDLRLKQIRGNVPTRLDKLRGGPYQAIVLAAAGLERLQREPNAAALGLDEFVSIRLDPAVFVPSPAQGAIALQCREGAPILEALATLHDPDAEAPVRAERELLRHVDGGCSLPFGAWARQGDDGGLELVAAIEAGGRLIRVRGSGTSPDDLAARVWSSLQAKIDDATGRGSAAGS
jgi:hydroxymethylbilane synthase